MTKIKISKFKTASTCKCFPLPYPALCTLLHNKFKPCALSDPTSAKLSPSSARALPLAVYTPKHHRRANITAMIPFCLLPGSPADTYLVCAQIPLQRIAQVGGQCARRGTMKPAQPLSLTLTLSTDRNKTIRTPSSHSYNPETPRKIKPTSLNSSLHEMWVTVTYIPSNGQRGLV